MKVRVSVPSQNEVDASSLTEKNLDEIISPALSELDSQSSEVSRYLISLAKDGSLEQHQTKGSITKLAEKLLQILEGQ